MFLRQSTASQELILGPFLDETDGKTPETGLTIANTDIKIWKHGTTTLANKNSGGATHIANGIYSIVLDATDTDTAGMIEVHVHVAGALPVWRSRQVVSQAKYDADFVNAATGIPATLLSSILASGDVDGYTVEQTLKLLLATLVGKVSGGGTNTITIRAADDSKARVTATVDTSGNRTSLTLDAAG